MTSLKMSKPQMLYKKLVEVAENLQKNSSTATKQSVDVEKKTNWERNSKVQNNDQQPYRQTTERFIETIVWGGRKREPKYSSVVVCISKEQQKKYQIKRETLQT